MLVKYGRIGLRACAWLGMLLLALASLTPGDEIVRTGMPAKIEHVVAYLLATAAWMLAYAGWPIAAVAAAFLSYAGILEIAQLWVPGRTAQATDFVASGAGVMLGLLLGLGARRVAATQVVNPN
jgi:VanZ family protein